MKINLAKTPALKCTPSIPELRSALGILVKFHGPTNTRGARVKAEFLDNTQGIKPITLEWDYSLSAEKNHANAAHQLATREGMRIDGLRICAGYGYIFPIAN